MQYSVLQIYSHKYIIIIRKGEQNKSRSEKGDNPMDKKKKKRRRHKPTARAKRMRQFTADILAATISGLIVLAVQKLLNW